MDKEGKEMSNSNIITFKLIPIREKPKRVYHWDKHWNKRY